MLYKANPNPNPNPNRPKLMYTGYFTSYKAVARKRRQSHGKK